VTPPSSLILAHAPDRQPPVGFGFPGPSGLCRLLRAPAGRRPFPTLSLRSLHGCLGPYPVAIKRCISPLLPARHRPLLRVKKIGLRTLFRNAALCGGNSRGCNHSVMFRLPCLLGPQAAPTMRALCPSRRRAVYTGQDLRRYRSQAPASLRVRTGQLTRQDLRGLTPARTCLLDRSLVGCSWPRFPGSPPNSRLLVPRVRYRWVPPPPGHPHTAPHLTTHWVTNPSPPVPNLLGILQTIFPMGGRMGG